METNKIKGLEHLPVKKETKLTKVELKNVICGPEDRDLTVEIVNFDRRNDDHVTFAFDYADFLHKSASPFTSQNEAARKFVQLFMAHKADDETNQDSTFSYVYNDLRASRTLFFTPEFQKQLVDFLTNA